MPCDRGIVKLEGVTVDVVIKGINESIRKQCLVEDNIENVHYVETFEEGTGDIVVFAEPELRYLFGHLARLLQHFADTDVNAVSGNRTDEPWAWFTTLWARPMLQGASAVRRDSWAGSPETTALKGKYVFEPKALAVRL